MLHHAPETKKDCHPTDGQPTNTLNGLYNLSDCKRKSEIENTTDAKIYSQRIYRSLSLNLGLIPSDSPYTANDYQEIADNLQHCGHVLNVAVSPDSGDHVITNGYYCQKPIICPICARRVSSRRRAIYHDPIKAAVDTYAFAYMLTLTIQSSGNLKAQYNALNAALRRFIRKGQTRGKRKSKGEWSKVKAGFLNVEHKRGSDGDWHIHSHALVFTNERIDYQINKVYANHSLAARHVPITKKNGETVLVPVSKLGSEWYDSTRGKGVNIRVDLLTDTPDNYKLKKRLERADLYGKGAEAIVYQANEVLKYNSKFGDLNKNRLSEDIYELTSYTRGRRQFRSYGSFRNMTAKEEYEAKVENPLDTYTIRWDGNNYVPGDSRTTALGEGTEIKREAGVELGQYMRRRNKLIKQIPNLLAAAKDQSAMRGAIEARLDQIKAEFKERLVTIYSMLRYYVPPSLPSIFDPAYL